MSANTLSPEEKFRVVLLGAARAGKTELCCAMLGREPPVRYTPTVEDLCSTNLGHVSLQILDTAGSFAFPAMRRLEINSADAIIIVHRADLPSTAQVAHDIVEEVRTVRDNPPPLLIVRNTILVDNLEEGNDDHDATEGVVAKGAACITANVRSEGRRVLKELLQQAQDHDDLFDRATDMAYTLTQIHLHTSGRRGSHQGHSGHHHHHHRLSAIAHDLKSLFRRRSH